MDLAQNVCLDDFRSDSKLDHLGSKTRSQGQINTNLIYTPAVTVLKQSSWILLKMFVLMILGQIRNWITWGQKLGHRAKSEEDLVNTPEVIFFK